jgi:hypothetical protein
MIRESQELLKRIDRMTQAESRQTLLEEIEQFLEDMELNEEARRVSVLAQISHRAGPLAQHLVLIFAHRNNINPAERDINHWKIEMRTHSREVLDWRYSISVPPNDDDVSKAIKDRLATPHVTSRIRNDLKKRYPQSVVDVFDSFKDPNSLFSKYLNDFLSNLASCHSVEKEEELIDSL